MQDEAVVAEEAVAMKARVKVVLGEAAEEVVQVATNHVQQPQEDLVAHLQQSNVTIASFMDIALTTAKSAME